MIKIMQKNAFFIAQYKKYSSDFMGTDHFYSGGLHKTDLLLRQGLK
ncbi:unknown [[Mannheimia] succiniciproducens MBEL55E]|uniref:Uncharacterized protein n=1 Tax=Mannheimia succiniciproducens (strain KCTC 0769BP / MBEL55E) TaxID=221988 RepID=Q65SF1_MANSM|nr:unknown [[Mannheimia] succiniciproducens MBEL55E]